MPLTNKDLRSDNELRNDGFNQDEIREFRNEAGRYFMLLVDLDTANENKDYVTVLDIEAQLPAIEFRLKYQGKHPRDIPLKELRTLLTFERDDPIEQKYVQRVRNPATAIRARCVVNMSGQPSEVKRCEAINCALWPFRFGTNPLFGKPLPPVLKDAVIEDDDIVEIEEETENEEDAAEAV